MTGAGMKRMAMAAFVGMATGAQADVSCSLGSPHSDTTTTLLIRDFDNSDEAVVLIADRTLIFECPAPVAGARSFECYGQAAGAIAAPTQLNISSLKPEPGSIVVVSTRNQFFGKNEHIGYARRIASMHMFAVTSCEDVGTSAGSARLIQPAPPAKSPRKKDK